MLVGDGGFVTTTSRFALVRRIARAILCIDLTCSLCNSRGVPKEHHPTTQQKDHRERAPTIKQILLTANTTKGGESNAKRILVLTPVVFALRLNAAIFADCSAVKYGICKRKSQIPRIKKAYRRLFCAGASSMTQPLFTLLALQGIVCYTVFVYCRAVKII